ncbi:molybdopterin molybdotransferase MoeA [Alteraurantiacibacter palmitatis]|uniref:Molybdopterin molybdenumtransferase n=1 Tax=Alteraurantiacibacter palmitatis TaxID=2054628 RepID=A0ABV7E3B0_9SPHN
MSKAGSLLDWQLAQDRLLAAIAPAGTEQVPTQSASGRILAQAVIARRNQPAADLSAMDGYAVGAGDPTGPWQLVGESAAGHPFAGDLTAGRAVRISTGALVPVGANAILLQENARIDGSQLSTITGSKAEAKHIRRAGFDFAAGDTLLDAGTPLSPAALALALMGGHGAVEVFRRPSLAIIDSGDELASDPAAALPHQIPSSNGPMLAAMAVPYVCAVERIGPVADNKAALLAALETASAADVIVTSGGASVGEHDLVRPALEEWGATIDFWRIALKPGKPLMVARRGKTVVLGLPGNPVSSFVTAWLFLLPLLRRIGGHPAPAPQTVTRLVEADLPATGDRAEFLRGVAKADTVRTFDEQDSSALRVLSQANALIYRPPGSPALQAGSPVQVFLLQNGGIA